MEEKLLLDISRLTDTHKRLQRGQELIEYFDKEVYKKNGFPDFGNLIGGLNTWLDTSSLQVNLMSMRILSNIVDIMKKDFYIYINTIFDSTVMRLGDAKSRIRESAHCLLLQVLDECTDSPQALLDRILDSCLVHRNWVMKEQGLIFLVRALNQFGVDKIDYKKYIMTACKLNSDSSMKVRKAAENALVDLYHIAGPEVREEMNRSNILPSKLKTLDKKLRDADIVYTTKSHLSRLQEFQERTGTDTGSDYSSKCSFEDNSQLERTVEPQSTKSSVGTLSPSNSKKGSPSLAESVRSHSSYPTILSKKGCDQFEDNEVAHKSSSLRALPRKVNISTPDADTRGTLNPRVLLKPPTDNKGKVGRSRSLSPMPRDKFSVRFNSPGTIMVADFEKTFRDMKDVPFQSKQDLDNKLYDIFKTLKKTEFHWELRLNSLKQIRGVFCYSQRNNMTECLQGILTEVADCLSISLKDLRSQVMREACATISYICSILQSEGSSFAAEMMYQLIPLLSSTIKVMASSADLCITYIIKNSPSPSLLVHLSTLAFPSKSNIIHGYGAKYLFLMLSTFNTTMLTKPVNLIEELIMQAVRDADAISRKYGRKCFWRYYQDFPDRANQLQQKFNGKQKKYLEQEKPVNLVATILEGEDVKPKSQDQKKQLKFKDTHTFRPEKTTIFQIYPENNVHEDKEEEEVAVVSPNFPAQDHKKQLKFDDNDYVYSGTTKTTIFYPDSDLRDEQEREFSGNSLNTLTSTASTTSNYSSDNSETLSPTWKIRNKEGNYTSWAHTTPFTTTDVGSTRTSQKSEVRSVKIQAGRKCRNVGIQAAAVKAEDEESKEDKKSVILQLSSNDLADFIEHTVERLLTKHDQERMDSELEQVKVLLDASVKTILLKLDSKPASDLPRLQDTNLNSTDSHPAVNWADPPSKYDVFHPKRSSYDNIRFCSLTSLADSDARGNLTPPHPTPNSSYASLIDLHQMKVLSSSPTFNSSTLPPQSERYSETSTNDQPRKTSMPNTSSDSPSTSTHVHYRSAPSQSSLCTFDDYALRADNSFKGVVRLESSNQSQSELMMTTTDDSEVTGSLQGAIKSNPTSSGSMQRNLALLASLQFKQEGCGGHNLDQ